MSFKILVISFLLLGMHSKGQNSQSEIPLSFDEAGIRIITKTELTPTQITQLLAFNFEAYRENNKSVILKVVDGPHIELYSLSRKVSGKIDLESPVTLTEHKEESGDLHTDSHILPSEREIKTLQIKLINVFTSISE